ncbi:MAG: hypothetical protein PHF57_12390 [Methanoregula sp.]|nr:hypothetical protein [Methanoregula sp.]
MKAKEKTTKKPVVDTMISGAVILPSYPLPLSTGNFFNLTIKTRHDRMVALVTQMLDLNKRLQDARLEQDKTQLSRQIAATDASIDKLVYELYGLTEEEIAIVEGNAK